MKSQKYQTYTFIRSCMFLFSFQRPYMQTNGQEHYLLRETDLRVNVANCFTKSRLAPLAGERIVSDAPRSDWPAGRFVSPSPARPPSPHWPANELFQTLNFWARTVLKTAIFHTIFTHCWLSIVSDFIRAFCFRVFLLFFNIDHLFRANVSQPILHVLMLYLSWFWKR